MRTIGRLYEYSHAAQLSRINHTILVEATHNRAAKEESNRVRMSCVRTHDDAPLSRSDMRRGMDMEIRILLAASIVLPTRQNNLPPKSILRAGQRHPPASL